MCVLLSAQKLNNAISRDSPPRRIPSKIRRMLLVAASTRYSLVKGERIVRFVLTAQLRNLQRQQVLHYIPASQLALVSFLRCGTLIIHMLISHVPRPPVYFSPTAKQIIIIKSNNLHGNVICQWFLLVLNKDNIMIMLFKITRKVQFSKICK